ncbi:hypothetical protein DSO57_1012815 [Entomophthora muscae]|uniref:Uncharacterized protein n=1 Tax=Entomophthora muscae TaxID=34485 RepID=A0ACC2RKN8_9FUNG|nr:hypothetical protein DSO57_1012815 [Entomophthora muscae]
MEVTIVPVLEDNYSYILADTKTQMAALVDPVEPEKVINYFNQKYPGFSLTSVLTTHHHWDHSSGNEEMHRLYPSIQIYGGDERIPKMSNKVKDSESFKLGSLNIRCISTPGHTTGHVCYFVEGCENATPVVFTGDTLFAGGCGRFFEGTPQEMYDSLCLKLSKLPPSTQVYCGHEYTKSNLKFAVKVDPTNLKLQKRLEWAMDIPCTIPSTIQQELETNPFLRVDDPGFQAAHSYSSDPVGFMGFLRESKNRS